MSQNPKIAASILCADFTNLGDEIKKAEDAGVDMFHVDVMDGHFVPNISIGQVIVAAIRPLTKLPIETHLMIEHPGAYLDSFMDAGADIISIHAECYGPRRPSCREWQQYPKEVDVIDVPAMARDLRKISSRGRRAFAVVNPGTPLCFEKLFDEMDGALIMSVNPGFAKQPFMPVALDKIRSLRRQFSKTISVDGGVNDQTAPAAVEAGADVLVTASYFFGAQDPRRAAQYLKTLSAGRSSLESL